MIIRIVKLTIDPEKSTEFIYFFNSHKSSIENVKGCIELTLLQDADFSNIFFTHSKWKDELSLNNYRDSELFKNIWGHAKSIFCDRPQAWTLNNLDF